MEKGQTIDSKYRIDDVLGGGSFSDVFVVEGPTGRSALKLLRKALSREPTGEAVADFKHEFAILKDLAHPNICRILDFGFDPQLKQYYYTTELVEGRDLFEATEGKSVDVVLELFVQALRAFHYLHSYKVFHFDVKAANMLTAPQTEAPQKANPLKSLFSSKKMPSPSAISGLNIKVIDFGLASIDPGGKMIGTPAYMAPEIIAKERPDARADLYSLGVLFYACLTRQNPFRAKSVPETLKNQQTLVAPPASSLREDIPPYLDRILARLLEKNPANRYQRADEVLREINSYSPRKFAMETRETLMSYLPEEGRLIGRKGEGAAFARSYERVFSPTSPDTMGFLLILGEPGTGKSRLLKDFKYASQLKGVSVESASVKDPEDLKLWLDVFRRQATEGRPTVFLLDDIDQWKEADDSFQQFRGALARLVFGDATDRLPVLWVGSAVSEEAIPASLKDLLSSLHSETLNLETLKLGPFSHDELKEYVSSLTGLDDPPAGLLDGLESRTNGNPLLVTELLRSLIDRGALFDAAGRWKKTTFEDLGLDFSKARFSGVLEELLYGRYEKLPAGLKPALEAMAVAGRLRAGEISRMTGIENPAPLLELLLSFDLITRDSAAGDEPGTRYHLKNGMLAELISEKLKTERLQELHDRAAELHPAGSPARIRHEMRGNDPQRAYELARREAEKSLQEAHGREAAELLRFALALPVKRPPEQEIEMMLKLGEACLISLDYAQALEAFGRVEQILSGMKDRLENMHLQVDALLRIGGVYLKMGEIEKSRGSLSAALALLHYLKGDRVRELVAENLRGAILVQEGKIEEARALFERTRTRWETELSAEECSRVTNNDLGVVCLMEHRYAEALKYLRRDLELHQALGDRLLLARTHYNVGQAHLGVKDFTAAVEHYQLSANLAQALKHTELLLRAYNGLGNACNLMGRADDAVSFYERGLDLCERTGDLRSHAAIEVNIGIIEASRGDYESAQRRLEPAIAFLKALKNRFAIDRQVLVRALLEEGDVSLKRKSWKPAEDALREALRISEEDDSKPLRFWILYTLAELHREKGDVSEFRKLLPEIKRAAQSAEEIEKLDALGPAESSTPPAPPAKPIEATIVQSITPPAAEQSRAAPPAPPSPAASIAVSPVPDASLPPDFRSRLLEIHRDVNAGTDLSLVFKKVVHLAIDLAGMEEGQIKEPSKKEIQDKLTEMSVKIEQFESLIQASTRRGTKYDYGAVVARSRPMLEIFRLLDKITDTDLAVFVHGESGTGKELIARALHDNSERKKGRFVAVNCGAIPATLMESELFGHKAGAFTGATRDKKGLFEEADGGTLFLDEVGELELTLQAKLLRAVQEGEFYRLGDNRPLKTDVRIVSASNKDIEKLSGDGRFREDLYYRLCQIRIDLPALRERREDIPILIDAFVRQEAGRPLKISSRLLKAMIEYDWPGNIRELENVVKVAVALAEDGVIDARSIPSNYAVSKYLAAMKSGKSEASVVPMEAPPAPRAPQPQTSLPKDGPAIDGKNKYDPAKSWYDYEKLIIAKAYRLTGFNAKEAGTMLGLAPATVYKKIRVMGLTDKNHPLYADEFHYEQGRALQDYLKPVFKAALEHAGNKPYTAIANLKVSQGYFYKVMKGA
ncbi:MAG TPA: sigma 54-interacting transcriptional regulator [bacterium]|nr:sigma 54-interacting transcriptional regulator [bacterium]